MICGCPAGVRTWTAGGSGPANGSSCRHGSAASCRRRSWPAATLSFSRASMTTEPGWIFSQNSSSASTAGAAGAAPAASCQRTVNRSAGPSSATSRDGCSSRRTAPSAEGASTGGEPSGSVNSSREVARRGMARSKPAAPPARAVGPKRQFQSILTGLGNLQQQGAAVGFPFRLHGPAVQERRVGQQPGLIAAEGDAHPRPAAEHVQIEIDVELFHRQPLGSGFLGQRTPIDSPGQQPALRLFRRGSGAAIQLVVERLGQIVFAADGLLPLVDGDENGVRRRLLPGLLLLRPCAADRRGPEHDRRRQQDRANGNHAGDGAG